VVGGRVAHHAQHSSDSGDVQVIMMNGCAGSEQCFMDS